MKEIRNKGEKKEDIIGTRGERREKMEWKEKGKR